MNAHWKTGEGCYEFTFTAKELGTVLFALDSRSSFDMDSLKLRAKFAAALKEDLHKTEQVEIETIPDALDCN